MRRSLEKILHKYLLSQIPLSRGLTVDESEPVANVISLMQENKMGCVLTKGTGKEFTGIFTERDLLNKVMLEPVTWDSPIKEFTTEHPLTMKETDPFRKALYFMRRKNFRHIPILDADGTLKGVLSVRNVVRLLAEHFPAEVMNLPPRLKQNPLTAEGG